MNNFKGFGLLQHRVLAAIVWSGLLLGMWLLWGHSSVAQETKAPPNQPMDVSVDAIFAGAVPLDVQDLKEMESRVSEVVAKIQPAVVGIIRGRAQGSGVHVGDGYILTAAHVCGAPNEKVFIVLHNGKRLPGVTLGSRPSIDSGLIRLEQPGDFPTAAKGVSNELKLGQWCLALGHPGGYQADRTPPVRLGRILQKTGMALLSDCTLVGGDSGGPLFNLEGQVIGIHSRIGGTLNQNVHVPIDAFERDWEDLVAGKSLGGINRWGRPILGVERDPNSTAAKILYVVPNSPAAKAGLLPGDVLTHIDGKPIDDFEQLAETIQKMRWSQEFWLSLERKQVLLSIKVRLLPPARGNS